jgi:peptide/nickel transport system substrate-binding protein
MGISRIKRGRRRGRVALIVAAALLTAGLIWGLTGALAESASPTAAKATLRVGWTQRPDNLNPFIGYNSQDWAVWHLNYDLLFGYKAGDVTPTPELAAEIPTVENGGISADGKTVTVKLRQGVKWQDGQPFTARDVAFTWNFIVDNQLGAFTMYTELVKHVEVVDDYTARFILTKPKAAFLSMYIFVLPEHIWSKVTPKAAENTYVNKLPIVGTGPFQTVKADAGLQTVIMDANPNYWRGRPKIDEVIFTTYENPDNMVNDLIAGGLQAAAEPPSAQFARLQSTPGITTNAYETKGFDELGFNCYTGKTSLGNPVLKDWRFRQALNYAIDHQAIVDRAYLGLAIPATTIIQSGFFSKELDWHWEPPTDQKYTFDLEKAKAALDAAGYKDVNGDGIRDYKGKPIVLRLYALSSNEAQQRCGRFITGWLQSIGLKIKYQVLDYSAMSAKAYATNKAGEFAPDWDMFLWSWGGDLDPTYILSVFLTNQINNYSDCAWSNPTYDALFTKQASQIDQQQRKQTIYEMQKLLYEQSPYIVLVYPATLEAYSSKGWTGWVRSPSVKGGAVMTYDNIDSYLFVQPASASAAAGGGSNAGLIVGIVVAVIVVIAIVVWLLRRRRGGGPVEEA